MGLITIAEAASGLSDEVYPEWDALEDSFKQYYIDRASSYITRNWTDLTTGFLWTDDTTWVAGTKDQIARYADADRAGLIYGDGDGGTTAAIKKQKQKIGTLETEVEYENATVVGASLSPIDDGFYALGYTKILNTGSLLRV